VAVEADAIVERYGMGDIMMVVMMVMVMSVMIVMVMVVVVHGYFS
jgi:hypothetical protein